MEEDMGDSSYLEIAKFLSGEVSDDTQMRSVVASMNEAELTELAGRIRAMPKQHEDPKIAALREAIRKRTDVLVAAQQHHVQPRDFDAVHGSGETAVFCSHLRASAQC